MKRVTLSYHTVTSMTGELDVVLADNQELVSVEAGHVGTEVLFAYVIASTIPTPAPR